MKRLLISILLIVSWSLIMAQANLTIEGQSFTNSEETWLGVDIPRSVPTKLIFRNNSISSKNLFGYLLQAGDESAAPANNKLDGAIITGNKLKWTGTDMVVIPHGIFTGHNIDVIIKHNYLDEIPMGIIRKSSTNMSNNSGGVSYNIVKGGAVGIVVKGMSNVSIINNTLYANRTPSQTWRPLVHIYTNSDFGGNSLSHGTKILNNIFYTKYETYSISVDPESMKDLECDYNIYWCENGSPVFNVNGSDKSFEQWQALGFDAHSIVMNPEFTDFINFIPSKRLDYGIPVSSEFSEGLSANARWSTVDPEINAQNGPWQTGAVVHKGSVATAALHPVLTSAFFKDKNPELVELNFNSVSPDFIPPASAFEVMVNSASIEVLKVNIADNTVFLSIARPITNNDKVTVSYSVPDNNPLQNTQGKLAPALSSRKVVNIKSQEMNVDFFVYPNPASDYITITNLPSVSDQYTLRIIDLTGKIRSEVTLYPGYHLRIPVDLPPGLYIINVLMEGKSKYIRRLVVVK